jgi:polar amino acid transport system substrate-binding protein
VGSYVESASALFHRGGATTLSSSDLSGKSVSLQAGSVSGRTLSNTTLVLTERTCTNLNEAFESLEAGSVDFALCDAYAGAYLASAYRDIALAGTLDAPLPAGIAVASNNTDFQTSIQGALNSIQTNGVMGIIRSRWVGGMEDLTSSNQIQGVTSSSAVLDTMASNGTEKATE